jgi:hypothetical protein
MSWIFLYITSTVPVPVPGYIEIMSTSKLNMEAAHIIFSLKGHFHKMDIFMFFVRYMGPVLL